MSQVDVVGSDPMEGVTRTSANEAVAAAEAAAAAAIAVNINQRLEFERQLALMSERMGQFERSAREAASEAFEKGRAVAMEARSTVAETAACSSNGLAARLDAYVIHTPPRLSEKYWLQMFL